MRMLVTEDNDLVKKIQMRKLKAASSVNKQSKAHQRNRNSSKNRG
jgi:hypothetical protein